jgi:hypothetical protein
MKPIRTYSIKVPGFPAVLYSARSPARARATAWHDYRICEEVSFKRFLAISSIARVPDPPGVGKRVLICGEPATTIYGHSSQYVWFMRDDSDVRLCSHPMDVQPCPQERETP